VEGWPNAGEGGVGNVGKVGKMVGDEGSLSCVAGETWLKDPLPIGGTVSDVDRTG